MTTGRRERLRGGCLRGTHTTTLRPCRRSVRLTVPRRHLSTLRALSACLLALTLLVPTTGGPAGGCPVTVAVLMNGEASSPRSTCEQVYCASPPGARVSPISVPATATGPLIVPTSHIGSLMLSVSGRAPVLLTWISYAVFGSNTEMIVPVVNGPDDPSRCSLTTRLAGVLANACTLSLATTGGPLGGCPVAEAVLV